MLFFMVSSSQIKWLLLSAKDPMSCDHLYYFLSLLASHIMAIHMTIPISLCTQTINLNNEFFQIIKVRADDNFVHTRVIYLPIPMNQQISNPSHLG